jgi:hypothetical protein
VPIILSCTVLSDEAGVVTRDVVFKPGMGPKPQARETVRSYYPSWVRLSPPIPFPSCYLFPSPSRIHSLQVHFVETEREKEVLNAKQVDFIQENNTVIKNIISAGPSLQDDDLHMTYAFELDYPGLEEGSVEAEAEAEKMTGMAKMAVEKSIQTIRAMVVDGRIKE